MEISLIFFGSHYKAAPPGLWVVKTGVSLRAESVTVHFDAILDRITSIAKFPAESIQKNTSVKTYTELVVFGWFSHPYFSHIRLYTVFLSTGKRCTITLVHLPPIYAFTLLYIRQSLPPILLPALPPIPTNCTSVQLPLSLSLFATHCHYSLYDFTPLTSYDIVH